METKFIDFFDKIYIINLESRPDRKKEIEAQLKKINLSINDAKITVFNAVKPEDAGEFPSIGAKGCFLSHLGVLKDIQKFGYKNALIFEDDLNFINGFTEKSNLVLTELLDEDWDIFYGDYCIENFEFSHADYTTKIDSATSLTLADFVGLNENAVDALVPYLEAMLARKDGDLRGGPMHVDGAYNWFRSNHPDFYTLVATPPLGYQRSSASDIANYGWADKVPFAKQIRIVLRKIREL